MNNIKAKQVKENIEIHGVSPFNIEQTLNGGQAFRWYDDNGIYNGVVNGYIGKFSYNNGVLTAYNCTLNEFNSIWTYYFDLDYDYNFAVELLRADDTMSKVVKSNLGLRILRQDTFEALVSFIFSQNNNIARIKGMVLRLCQQFGEPIGDDLYSFPTASRLAVLSVEDLSTIRAGFRAGYLIDAAKKVHSGAIDLKYLTECDITEARQLLQTIKGVGPKVAECVLLYGCARKDAFPIDVWIKRAMDALYPQGLPGKYTEYAGIAQQYLFSYAREGALL